MFCFLLSLQSISISTLGVGVGTESADVVRNEPPAPAPIVSYSVRVKFTCFNFPDFSFEDGNKCCCCYLHFILIFSLVLCDQQNKPQPSTTTFVLNQLNHLPSLGAVVTKQSATNNIKHTITVTKVVHVPNSALRSSSTSSTSIASSASTVVPSTRSDQVLSVANLVCSKKWKSQLVKDTNKETLRFILC